MIGKNQKTDIKKLIGHRYVGVIQAELKEMSQVNRKGKVYSSAHITNVMNGEAHKVIEDAIWKVVEKQILLNEKRKQLFL